MPDKAGDISVPSESDEETPGHKRSFSNNLMTAVTSACTPTIPCSVYFAVTCWVELFATVKRINSVFLYFAIYHI